MSLPAAPGFVDTGRPFLKWAGGKRQLLPALLPRVPLRYGRYFEPFVGGGALFFALRPARAVLADVNARLIRTYKGVRDDVGSVIALLKSYPHDAAFFQSMRALDIDARPDAEVAAWFIYLNRTGYNGLYRVNRSDRFNVPFGRYVNPTVCDERTLRACAAALQNAELVVKDFETVTRRARRNDFVYFDPPYVPVSSTSSFTSYTATGFGPDEQVRLRDTARRLKARGVGVMISNSSAPVVRRLYAEGFTQQRVQATRMVNSHASRRGKVAELVIW